MHGSKFKTVKMQVDTGTTRNTISDKDVEALSDRIHVTKSPCVLGPYGDRLVGKRDTQFHTLSFQVLPDHIM